MERHPQPLWIYVGLAVLILSVYGQVVRFDFTNYDDPDYVIDNPHVTSALSLGNLSWAMTSGYAANWHPLTWFSHMLDFQLFGMKSGLHHLTSVLLHIISSIILFVALRRMTGAFWCSALVAGLFALHPLRVESVAWVAERKDVLSTLFWMLTMFCYVRYVEQPSMRRYLPVVISFGLGLMAKSMLVTLPFTLLLLDFWPLHRLDRGNIWRRIVEKVPLLAMSATVSAITYFVQQHGGAVASLAITPPTLRFENVLLSYAIYLKMLIWPAGLEPIYRFSPTIPLWQLLAAALVLATISLFVLLKGRSHRYLVVGWLWYLGTLIPVIGLIQVGAQSRADRYTYVPSIGILLMVVWGVWDLCEAYPRFWPVASTGAVVMLLACIGSSAIQVSYWRNSITLFRHAIAVSPDNDIAYNNLGAALLAKSDPGGAVFYLSKALEYNPVSGDAHANLGMALDDLGRRPEALSHFQAAIQIDPKNADAQAGLGLALAELGTGDEALPYMREALSIRPNSAHYYFELGEVFGLLERLPEAEQAFHDSIRLDPSDPKSHFNLGIALGKQGKLSEAIDAFHGAIRLKPEYPVAWFNLGSALAQDGQLDESVKAFSEAIRLQPDYPDARDALATAQELLRPHE